MSITDRIINDESSDYHVHSMFSDWLATIEEIVQYAWILGMKEIAITDHCDIYLQKLIEDVWITPWWWAKYALKYWENVWNDVKVIFWVEADVLDEQWNVCFETQHKERSKFTILSLHSHGYTSPKETSTVGILSAIERYHDKIDCIWHPYDNSQNWEFIDIKQVVELANNYDIPIEFNAASFAKWHVIEENLLYVLHNAKKIYINSDAHTLSSLRNRRSKCYEYIHSIE